MRFCSRCGFQLGVVTTLIATGGVPPAVIVGNDTGKSKPASSRSRRHAAKLMFLSGVVFPLAMGLGILVESPLPLMIPFTIFLAGLAWMYYFRWFGEEVSPTDHQSSPTQLGGANQIFLASSQTQFATDAVRQAHRTAEIVQPPSVTEHTTRLLDAEKENQSASDL